MFLAILSNVTMNIGVLLKTLLSVVLDIHLKSGIIGSYDNLSLIFSETTILFSTLAAPFLLTVHKGSSCSVSCQHFFCLFLDSSHPKRIE